MSIELEIGRIAAAKNKIRAKLVALGLAQSTANIDTCATAVDGIADNGAVSIQVKEGDTYTIPKGYHNGSGTVSGIGGGGNYTLQSKTVNPTKEQQNITPDHGYYGMSDVTVNPIPEIYNDTSAVTAAAADVLANKIIVDAKGKTVAGTMHHNGALNATIDGLTTTQYTVPAGCTSGGTIKLSNAIENRLKEI